MLPEKIIKEDFKMQKLSFEYVLPDYEPTVKRVMLVDARLLPNERMALSDSLTVSGVVEYRMVYQSIDDELSSLSFTVPYECTLAAAEGAMRLVDRVALSSFSCMPSGPRRILAKGDVCATLQSIGCAELPAISEEGDIVTLNRTFPYTAHLYSADEEREYAQTIAELTDANACILYSDGALRIDEARCMKDGAYVSGKCIVSALISENQKPRVLCGEIAFEEFLPMGGVPSENAPVLCEGKINSLSLEVLVEEGAVSLVANVVLSFAASVSEECEARLPLDAYATSCEVDIEMGEQLLVRERYAGICRHPLKVILAPEEADPAPMVRLLFVHPTVKILECAASADAIDLTVGLSLSLVGLDADSTPEEGEAPSEQRRAGYVRQRCSESIEISIPIKGVCPGMHCGVSSPCVCGLNAFFEDGKLHIEAELSFFASVSEESRVPVCADIRRTERSIRRLEDAICVILPQPGDTLWSVAKSNHVRIDEVLKENPMIRCEDGKWDRMDSIIGMKHIFMPIM